MPKQEFTWPSFPWKDIWDKGVNYSDHRTEVEDLLLQGKASGHIQNEAYLQYTKMNLQRMRRWDKTFQLSASDISKLQHHILKPTYWLVLTEGWCGDAGHALPIMYKITLAQPLIQLRCIYRDQNEELIDAFLTDGARSIPKLIQIEPQSWKVTGVWGPRPVMLQNRVKSYKEEHGTLDAVFKEELQRWYNKDKGKQITLDLLDLLISQQSYK